MDGVGRFEHERTDIEVRVELFEVGELRFGAETDKLCLVLIQMKSSRCAPVSKALDTKLHI